jgi:hypothetical protein
VFNVAYSSQWISFFLNIPQYNGKIFPSWHAFKHFAAVLIGLLHLQPLHEQPFPLPHYCGTVSFKVLIQCPKQLISHKVWSFSVTLQPHTAHVRHITVAVDFHWVLLDHPDLAAFDCNSFGLMKE